MIPTLRQRVRIVGMPGIYLVVSIDIELGETVLMKINNDASNEMLTVHFDDILPAHPAPESHNPPTS